VKRFIWFVALSCVCLASVEAAGATLTLPGFRSPSGNISCLLINQAPGVLLCNPARADYRARLQAHCIGPNGGGVDWHGFILAANRKGAINCSGGILYNPSKQRPRYVSLAYGKSWRQGPFICVSQIVGVTCRSRAWHGLFVSRQSWRVW